MGNPKASPATGDQKEIYAFFKMEVADGLTREDAQGVIDGLFEDGAKLNAWESYVEHLEEQVGVREVSVREVRVVDREGWLATHRDYANEDAEFYGCKKLTEAMFKRTVGLLEAKGMSLEEIGADLGVIFETALQIDPGVVKAKGKRKRKRRMGWGCMGWILILLLIGIYYVYWKPRS